MSTRLNLLLICMLMLLSVSVLAPYALRHREQVIATGKATSDHMTMFSQRLFGQDKSDKADSDAADVSKFVSGMDDAIHKMMTDNSREISHMLTGKAVTVRDHLLEGAAVDRKTMEKNFAAVEQQFPEVVSDLKTAFNQMADATGVITRQFAELQGGIKGKTDNIHKVSVKSAPVAEGNVFDMTKLLSGPSEMLKSQFQTIFHAPQADIES